MLYKCTIKITLNITMAATTFYFFHDYIFFTETEFQFTWISVCNIPGNRGRNKTGFSPKFPFTISIILFKMNEKTDIGTVFPVPERNKITLVLNIITGEFVFMGEGIYRVVNLR